MGSIPIGCLFLVAFLILVIAHWLNSGHKRSERKVNMDKVKARKLLKSALSIFVAVGVGSLGGAIATTRG